MDILPVSFKFADKFRAIFNVNLGSRRPKLPESLDSLAKRVQYLVKAHGLNEAQLLRLIPAEWDWKLSTIGKSHQLVDALGAAQIAWFAETFDVEQSWLEGTGEWASIPFSGYKEISALVAEMRNRGWVNSDLKMTILAEGYFDNRFSMSRYAIVFSSPIVPRDQDSPKVYKHKLSGTQWPWGEWPCRLDTKAVARWFSMHLHRFGRIPIVPIRSHDFTRVTRLEIPPAEFVPDNPVGYEFLEDRVLRPIGWPNGESHVATESEELNSVVQHLEASGLLAAASQDTNAVPNLK